MLSISVRARNLVRSFKYEAQSPWVKGEVSGDEAKRNASLSFSLYRKAEIHNRNTRVDRSDLENVYTSGQIFLVLRN